MLSLSAFKNFDFQALLSATYWNNTGYAYLNALIVFFLSLLLLKLFKRYILYALRRMAKKTETHIDDYFVEFLGQIYWPFYLFVAVYAGSKNLFLGSFLEKVFDYGFMLVIAYYLIKGLQKVVDYFLRREVQKREKEGNHEDTSFINVMGKMIKGFIWVVAVLALLSNLGVNITSLIAGLGIGGVAIAFALQNVLNDLFSAFTIYFDKPFREGDFIIIGKDMGVIKRIGLKSTRIQALGGQELVISNRELTTERINNYKKMQKRRVEFSFGVEYSTPIKKLKKINELITGIIGGIKGAELDRVHFKGFGESSLNYEVVYYLSTNDYNKYMDVQQQINLSIVANFEKENISMAFPTRTLFVHPKLYK